MLKDLSDEALMDGYLNGDTASFELIYARYCGKVMTFLRSKLRSKEEQEEVFQLVFMKFHKARHLYDSKYPLLQWLFVISRSVYLDRLKQTRRQGLISESLALEAKVSGAISDVISETDLETNSDLLGVLDETQREIVKQRILDEASFEEIANRLDLTPTNVRQKLSRALKKLRSSLKLSQGESK